MHAGFLLHHEVALCLFVHYTSTSINRSEPTNEAAKDLDGQRIDYSHCSRRSLPWCGCKEGICFALWNTKAYELNAIKATFHTLPTSMCLGLSWKTRLNQALVPKLVQMQVNSLYLHRRKLRTTDHFSLRRIHDNRDRHA